MMDSFYVQMSIRKSNLSLIMISIASLPLFSLEAFKTLPQHNVFRFLTLSLISKCFVYLSRSIKRL